MFVYGEMEKCLNPHVHGKKKKDAPVSIRGKTFRFRQHISRKRWLSRGAAVVHSLLLSVFNQ